MAKKGRCPGFRQRPFDVSATTECCRGCRHCYLNSRFEAIFPEVRGKSEIAEYNPILGNKTAGRVSTRPGSGRPTSVFLALPDSASAVGFVLPEPHHNNGQNSQFRVHTKTPAGAKLLLPALA